jgi:hypothetical protein
VRNVVSRRRKLGFQFLAHASSRISNLFGDALQSLAGESKVRGHVATPNLNRRDFRAICRDRNSVVVDKI